MGDAEVDKLNLCNLYSRSIHVFTNLVITVVNESKCKETETGYPKVEIHFLRRWEGGQLC